MKLKWALVGIAALLVILLFSNPSKQRCNDEFKKDVQGRLLKDTYNMLKKDDNILNSDTSLYARQLTMSTAQEAATNDWETFLHTSNYLVFTLVQYQYTKKQANTTLGIGLLNNFIHL